MMGGHRKEAFGIAWTVLVASALAQLLVGCAGCACGANSSVDDAGVADARIIDISVDVGVDRGIDRGIEPDQGKPATCGGTRTLKPVVITPGPAQPCGPGCKQISWGPTADHRYEVTNDLLAYFTSGGPGFRVFTIDLKSGVERRWHPERPNDVGAGCALVATDGTKVVTTCVQEWKDRPEFEQSITVLNPNTKSEEDLLCLDRSVAADNCFPTSIGLNNTGITVDWTLGRCQQSTALFLPTGATKLVPLTTPPDRAAWVMGQGDKIVWHQYKSAWGGWRIVVHDLITGKEWPVDPRQGKKGDQWGARIEGDKIVWMDHRNDPSGDSFDPRNVDIYHHDLTTGLTRAVTTHAAKQERPDVYGDWVVWHDYRATANGLNGKNIDVYAKNMKTNEVVGIATSARSEAHARVDRERVFFRARNDALNLHFFMVDIPTLLAAKKKTP
jgi:beta propeller repeat protein